MDITSTIILGITSGIITAFIIWFGTQFFIKIIIPWFESIVYKGIDLSGDWKSTVALSPSNFKVKLDITIQQKGHKLNGHINAVYINTDDNTEKRNRKLNFTGIISDDNVVITYNSANKSITSQGVFLLKQHLGGEQLKGTMVSSDRITNGIISYENVFWKRI